MPGARRASRRRYVLLVIVLTCLTLITLDTRNGRSGPARRRWAGSRTGSSRPCRGRSTTSPGPVGDWWDGVTDSGDIKKENRELEQQVAALKGQADRGGRGDQARTADLKASARS